MIGEGLPIANGCEYANVWRGTDIGFDHLPLFCRRNMPRLDADLFPAKMEKRDANGKVLMTQDVGSITVY